MRNLDLISKRILTAAIASSIFLISLSIFIYSINNTYAYPVKEISQTIVDPITEGGYQIVGVIAMGYGFEVIGYNKNKPANERFKVVYQEK